MAALRGVLQQAGRKQVAEHQRLTNKALGLSGASRNGTRVEWGANRPCDILISNECVR